MTTTKRYLILFIMSMLMVSCHSIDEWDNDKKGNFDALWTILDQHYCFFKEKGIDWDAVYATYSQRISEEMTQKELFDVCSDMLDELRDGHTNLSSVYGTSYYRKWWSDYPQNYNERLWQEYYFNFNYTTVGGIDYGILPENVGYMHYSSFSYDIGEGNLDAVLSSLVTCTGLIIDIRDNSGGDMDNVETLVRRFLTTRTLAGYIIHKTGTGHNDFSEPYAYYYDPTPQGRYAWNKPVAVLTNRSTFSAANNFVAIMKSLPNVAIIGATTGGGSGMPYSSELPNGWGIRFSACSVLDPNGDITEFGIDPTEGCEVDLDEEAAISGHDTMIDFAVEWLTN